MAKITFSNNINVSAQIGDILFHHTFEGDPGTELGRITNIGVNQDGTFFVEIDSGLLATAQTGDFFSFKKSSGEDLYQSNSSVKGYYAKVKITNDQLTKKELFYIGAEITESSK